jgi:aspartyl protease family protein
MPITIPPEWQQIAFYALGAALVLILLQRIPYVGRVVRFAFSLGLLALFIFLLIQQAPYEPNLARLAGQLGLDRQEVVGKELRIKMAPDGHFWANATINGQKVRMLIDSGATITALSNGRRPRPGSAGRRASCPSSCAPPTASPRPRPARSRICAWAMCAPATSRS